MNEVVEPAAEVDSVADEVEKKVDLVGRPADDESAAYHQWRHHSVTSGCAKRGTVSRTNLHVHRGPIKKVLLLLFK